jgi:hypothetical protein
VPENCIAGDKIYPEIKPHAESELVNDRLVVGENKTGAFYVF